MIPSTLNVVQNTLATNSPISDFSDWTAMGSSAPTAAAVSVSGRVTTPNGYALNKARVTLIDGDGNVLTAITNPFGYYIFDSVKVGRTYVASVSAKGRAFQSRTLTVADSLTDVDFEAAEGGL